MPPPNRCRICGSAVQAGAGGHCPKCLIRLGFEGEDIETAAANAGIPARRLSWADGGKQSFGDYEIIAQIGRGGMGVVYRARQISLNRFVAIKMIADGHLASPSAIVRFRLEAEAAARLDHPGIVSIYEVGEHLGHHFFAMKLVEGGSLAGLLSGGPRSERDEAGVDGGAPGRGPNSIIRERIAMLIQIARAVHHAHQFGVLHRDLKPGNILIDRAGQPVVTDFGLAKVLERSVGVTLSGEVMGTPGYMSPEQAAGRTNQVSTASDTYSLGAILFRMLTGRLPFDSGSPMETLRQIIEEEPVRPRRLNASVDRDLETICLRCLERDPTRRYASAEGLADDLDRWRRGEPIQARPVSAWERGRKWVRRHPAIASLVAVIACTLALGLVATTWQWRRAERARRTTAATAARLQLQKVEELFASDRAELALATLARALRDDPANRAVQERLVNALKSRSFLMPILDRPTPEETAEFGLGVNSQVALCQARQGPLVADATAMDGTVLVQYGPADPRRQFRLPRPGVIRSVAISPDGRWLAVATAQGSAGAVVVWDLISQELVAVLEHSAEVNALDFSPVRPVLATGDADGVVRLWQVGSFTNLAQIAAHPGGVNAVRFHPGAPVLLTGGNDDFVRAWRVDRLQSAVEPRSLGRPVEDLRVGHSGNRVFARLASGAMVSLKWCEAVAPVRRSAAPSPNPSLEPIAVVLGAASSSFHAGVVTCTNFSPSGDRLATASTDHSARLWDVRTRRALTDPLLHDAVVNAVQFSPDSLRVATSTSNRRVRVWDVAMGVPLTDWLETEGPVIGVSFTLEGSHVVASTGQAWALERADGPAPEWLPALAEAVAMLRIDELGVREILLPADAAEVCRRVGAHVWRRPTSAWAQRLGATE